MAPDMSIAHSDRVVCGADIIMTIEMILGLSAVRFDELEAEEEMGGEEAAAEETNEEEAEEAEEEASEEGEE